MLSTSKVILIREWKQKSEVARLKTEAESSAQFPGWST